MSDEFIILLNDPEPDKTCDKGGEKEEFTILLDPPKSSEKDDGFVILLGDNEARDTDDSKGKQKLSLGEKAGVDSAADLHKKLVAALDGGEDIGIDASLVSVIDTPALQLLISAQEAAAIAEQKFLIQKPSNAFKEAARNLDYERILRSSYSV
ncbi:STAS domain-containing protein [Zhongshania aliphaticivorans]|uniref:STAS domain-containing protein n=1 Tax=Zhongshania aliphaticivorans TaxID=1470434 RepID=UPI0012E40D97|nr:STAS domain-containing protein [Zhongshania aliphaticivorans]CAA0107780.1 Uncharacterised protein [Zhongshania aliphaticivorans]